MEKLWEPIEIKGLRIENRIVAAPMATNTATGSGLPTADTLEWHQRMASTGVGLAIVEHHAVTPQGRTRKRQMMLDSDDALPYLKDIPELYRKAGVPVIVQINHAGSFIQDEDLVNGGGNFIGPSAIRHPRCTLQVMPTAIAKQDMEGLVQSFADAAVRGRKAGYDGIEIHACHGFLLGQFLSPITNRRSDEYGGKPLNRARLLFEIYEAVRSVLGDFPLAVRLGVADTPPGEEPAGQTVEDSLVIARELAALKVDLLDISGNMCLFDGKGSAWFAPWARALKDVIGKTPLVCTGGIREFTVANDLITEKACDIAGVGRELLKNPKLIHSWKNNG